MPRKATVDDMVDAIREVGRPCTKQDIADGVDVARQTIANHADELERDPRVDHGKVGTAQAYWLKEWSDTEEGKGEGENVVYSETDSYPIGDNEEEPPDAHMGERMLVDYRSPRGETEFIDELPEELADSVKKLATQEDITLDEAFNRHIDTAARSLELGPYSKSTLEKIASPQTIIGSISFMIGGSLVMVLATLAQSIPVLALSLIIATVMIVLSAILAVLAALAQIALARPLKGLVGFGTELKT